MLSIIIILSLGIFRPVDSMFEDLFFNYKEELGSNREPRIWEGSGECSDQSPLCPNLKSSCGSDQMTKNHCPMTCGICPQPGDACKDTYDFCSSMKTFCATDRIAQKHCRKTCGLCQPEPIKCEDHHLGCKVLVKYCNINEEMKSKCTKSCDQGSRLLLKVGEDIISIDHQQVCGSYEAAQSRGRSDKAAQSKVCKDKEEYICPIVSWGCAVDPRVKDMCPLSCGVCTVEEPEEEEDSDDRDFYAKKKEEYQETAIEAGPVDKDDDYNSREIERTNVRDCPKGGCGHGICLSRYSCSCSPGWTGARCNQKQATAVQGAAAKCPGGCGNGECVAYKLCQCYEGWRGKSCSKPMCEGGCGNGYCLHPGVCRCKKGFTGSNCEHFSHSVVDPQSHRGTKVQHGSGLTLPKPVKTMDPPRPAIAIKGTTAEKAGCEDIDPKCHLMKSLCENKKIRGLCAKTCGACGEVQLPQPMKTKAGASQPMKTKGGSSQSKGDNVFGIPKPAPITRSNFNGRKSIGGSPCECGLPNEEDFTGRIVGGIEVNPPHKYPWQVALKLDRSITASCSGTLINEKWVLSAAHCYANIIDPANCWNHDDEIFTVTIGEHDQRRSQDNAPYYQVIPVKRHVLHPNWDCHMFQWDFALIELATPVVFGVTENLKLLPICLPVDASKTYEDLHATVSGWGLTSDGGIAAPTLQEVSLQVRDMNCGGYKYILITHDKMCAGGTRRGTILDSCQGDSGGPLFLPYYDGYIQIGVVSSGVGCAQEGHPGIYARITKALDWINLVTSMNHGYCKRQ